MVGLKVFNVAAAAGRLIGIPIPSLPSTNLEISSPVLTRMKESLLDFTLEDSIAWGSGLTQEGMKDDLDNIDLDGKRVMELSGAAYNSIETFLTTGENAQLGTLRAQLEGRMAPLRGDDGTVEWSVLFSFFICTFAIIMGFL